MTDKPTYEELEQRIALLENESAQRKRFEEINHALFKISNAVNMTSSLDELFRSIHLALSHIIDTTNFYIALYDKTKDSVTFPYCVDAVDECYPPVIEVSSTASLTAEVIRTGRPLLVSKAEILAQRAASIFKIPTCTPSEIWLGVPLKTRDDIIGVMAVQSYHDPLCYDQTDMDVMVSVADQVAIAVERKYVEKTLQTSERQKEAILNGITANIAFVDKNLKIVWVNKAAAESVNKSPDEMIGRICYHFWADPSGPCKDCPSLRAMDTKKSEHTIMHAPDGRVWNERGEPIFDAEGNLMGVVEIAIDITELKRAEAEKAELAAQNRQLQKFESLGRMAGAIAHHFNNKLYAVMGNLEMAMDELPPGVILIERLSSAMQAAHKAADVSKLMLTYLGKTPGKHELIDVSKACRQSLTLLQAATPKGIIIGAEFPASGPVIRADTNQMHQILANLITNAWESISENRGTIGLTVKTVSHVDIPTSKRFPIDWQPQRIPYACLEVSDTGCGIPESDIEKIFDPFFTTQFTGRGLGLPVVMGIVKAHGGGVTVESEPGRGSVFRVFLPVSTEELPCRIDLTAISGALLTSKAEKVSKIEGGGTVLLIEDEEQVRNVAAIMLTRLGYRVLEAEDGVEALEIFQQQQEDIRFVLSDLTIPRMNGWETLSALRKLSPDIPVILSSGYDEAQVLAGEHPERPNAFLGKPYQLKGLGDTINRVLTAPAGNNGRLKTTN
jgi:PAS domain S-box-containing protein